MAKASIVRLDIYHTPQTPLITNLCFVSDTGYIYVSYSSWKINFNYGNPVIHFPGG